MDKHFKRQINEYKRHIEKGANDYEENEYEETTKNARTLSTDSLNISLYDLEQVVRGYVFSIFSTLFY